MEESEKRRERLRAMRIEAGDVSSPSPSPSSSSLSSLSNPLLDRPDQDSHSVAPRFGFYTDPMAAFSADKRRTPRSNFPLSPSVTGIKNPETPVSGVPQFQSNYSPYQSMHQGGDPYCSPHAPATPMGLRTPYFVNQGSPNFNSAPGRGYQFNNSPSPGGNSFPVHQGSPNFRSPPPGRGWYNTSPYPGSGPGLGRGGSPSPGQGRGRSRWDGSGRGSGSRYSSGRGRGSYVDAQARSFYHKSMVEDPWESLTPVIWKGDNDTWSKYSNQGSLQKTPTTKKPRVSDPLDTSNSKQSLAEFLAASFDEAVGDAAGS